MRRAMELALEDAGIGADAIGYGALLPLIAYLGAG